MLVSWRKQEKWDDAGPTLKESLPLEIPETLQVSLHIPTPVIPVAVYANIDSKKVERHAQRGQYPNKAPQPTASPSGENMVPCKARDCDWKSSPESKCKRTSLMHTSHGCRECATMAARMGFDITQRVNGMVICERSTATWSSRDAHTRVAHMTRYLINGVIIICILRDATRYLLEKPEQ
jgi:hypothetical protein